MHIPSDESVDAFQLFTSVRHDAALRRVAGDPAFAHAGWNYKQASPYYMLDLHRDRLLRAATHWRWEAAVSVMTGEAGLQRLEAVLDGVVQSTSSGEGSVLRCRVTLRKDGQLRCEAFAAAETPLAGLFPPELPPPGFMMASGVAAEDSQEAPPPLPLLSSLRAAMAHELYEVTLDAGSTTSSPYTHYKTTHRHMYDAARQRAGIKDPERREVLLVNGDSGAVMDGSLTTVYLWRNGRWVTPPVPPAYSIEGGSGGLDGTTRRWALERTLAAEEDVKSDTLRDGEECWLSNGVRGFMYGQIRLALSE
ncbi:Aminotransferase, class IV [Niveomyces insectorum RCEF 264]|uniref:Aminotransferase, class IV n=1 Tax=Niveomyces insectorum RCEF 264 TaxID=1081102 RepID=A0A168AG74_9HYPO|nr:Aminotransferase, class IV [Niveomyces insectorum RCEF 264]